MPTDSEVMEWIDALPECFLKLHVRAAVPMTESPAIFHVGAALAILGACAPLNVFKPHAGSQLHPNVFVINLGPSGIARKGPPIRIAFRHLTDELGNKEVVHAGSNQAFEANIMATPHGILAYEEAGDFFGRVDSPIAGNIVNMMNDLWDCKAMKVNYVGRGLQTVPDPRISFLAGSNMDMVDKYVSDLMVRGGWLGRFLIFEGVRGKLIPDPNSDGKELKPARAWLHARAKHHVARTVGCTFTPECKARHDSFYMNFNEKVIPMLSGTEASIASRIPIQLLKIMMLLQWDANGYGNKWELELWTFEAAKKLVLWSFASSRYLVANIAGSPFAKKKRSMQQALTPHWEHPASIISRCDWPMSKVEIMQILETLQFEGKAERDGTGENSLWRRRV